MNWRRIFLLAAALAYPALGTFFFYKYVPLIPGFLLILLPVLFLLAALTALRPEWGLLGFAFGLPLLNNLPYFFGVEQYTPHAPVALVLFLAFLWGWLLRRAFGAAGYPFRHRLFMPLLLLTVLAAVSGAVTLHRYANFFPFLSERVYELTVNVNGVRAGGALMNCVFSLLNFLSGFFLLAISARLIQTEAQLRRVLVALSGGAMGSFLFAVIQRIHSPALGNVRFFAGLDRLNGTFKDPNSFGLFLAGFLPILLGLSLAYSGRRRLAGLGLLALGLVVLSWTGSRSGMLGLGLAFLLFILLSFLRTPLPPRRKGLFFALALSAFLALAAAGIVLSRGTTLYERLSAAVEDILTPSVGSGDIGGSRVRFWRVALAMVKDFPLTGVGLGGYIIELPNYSRDLGYTAFHTDTAENYFVQVAAELGLVGLAAAAWLFYRILLLLAENWRRCRTSPSSAYLRVGLICGAVAVFVNLFFHSYGGAFDAVYFIWLVIAALLVTPRRENEPPEARPGGRMRGAAVALGILAFGAVHFWDSATSLSIGRRTEKYGWRQVFGLYQREGDGRGHQFNWARKTAGISLENLKRPLVVPLRASHPDIGTRPVEVEVYRADPNFKKRERLGTVKLGTPDWAYFEHSLQGREEAVLHLLFETARDWQPSAWLGVQDPRRLAIALGDPWFRPIEAPDHGLRVAASYPESGWLGQYGRVLRSRGSSVMRFEASQDGVSLRLHLRGEKAYGTGPLVIIRLDERVIGKTRLEREDWVALLFPSVVRAGRHELSVEFVDDYYSPESGEDRNVFLGGLELVTED